MFIIVKIKYVNSGNLSDIYDKFNFTTNYIHCITTDTYFIKKHTHIIIFDTYNGTVYSGT